MARKVFEFEVVDFIPEDGKEPARPYYVISANCFYLPAGDVWGMPSSFNNVLRDAPERGAVSGESVIETVKAFTELLRATK